MQLKIYIYDIYGRRRSALKNVSKINKISCFVILKFKYGDLFGVFDDI